MEKSSKMTKEKIINLTQDVIADMDNIQKESLENHKNILEFEKQYKDIKDLMFVVIPVYIDWTKFDFDSDEQKAIVVEKFCKEMVAEPLTITHTELDDYGQQIEQEKVIGVITRMEEKADGEFRAFGAIWTQADFELSIDDKFIEPKGIHIGIDFDLNKTYGHFMKKQKEISNKIHRTICEALAIDNIIENKDKLKDLGLFDDEELPKPEFEKFLENQDKKEDINE